MFYSLPVGKLWVSAVKTMWRNESSNFRELASDVSFGNIAGTLKPLIALHVKK